MIHINELVKFIYKKICEYASSHVFYHYVSCIYLCDNVAESYTIIKDHKNRILGLWFWESNCLYVFQCDTNTTLAYVQKELCFNESKKIIFDADFNIVEE